MARYFALLQNDIFAINKISKRNVMLSCDVHCAFCSDVHPRTYPNAIIFELMLLLKPTFVKLLMIYMRIDTNLKNAVLQKSFIVYLFRNDC